MANIRTIWQQAAQTTTYQLPSSSCSTKATHLNPLGPIPPSALFPYLKPQTIR